VPPLPPTILAFDVETTGVTREDRVVSLGAVLLHTASLAGGGPWRVEHLHLVFNPGRPCHPRARAVHGFDDLTLSRQEPFADRAAEVARLFARAGVAVAHNLHFDLRFVNGEFAAAGLGPVACACACSVRAHRAAGYVGSAGLDAATARLGLSRGGSLHGALEDAWLALMVYLDAVAGLQPLPFATLAAPGLQNLRPGSPRRRSSALTHPADGRGSIEEPSPQPSPSARERGHDASLGRRVSAPSPSAGGRGPG
jgi:DNA polymerase III subunit epsilon